MNRLLRLIFPPPYIKLEDFSDGKNAKIKSLGKRYKISSKSLFFTAEIYNALGADVYNKLLADEKHIKDFAYYLNYSKDSKRAIDAINAFHILTEQFYANGEVSAGFGENVARAIAYNNSTLDSIQEKLNALPPDVARDALRVAFENGSLSINSPFLDAKVHNALGVEVYNHLLSVEGNHLSRFAYGVGEFNKEDSERMLEALTAFRALSEQIYGQGQFNAELGRNVLDAFRNNRNITLETIQERINAFPADVPRESLQKAIASDNLPISAPLLDAKAYDALGAELYVKLFTDKNARLYTLARETDRFEHGSECVFEALRTYRALSEQVLKQGELNTRLGCDVLEAFRINPDLTLKTIQERTNEIPNDLLRSVLLHKHVGVASLLVDNRAYATLGEAMYKKLLVDKNIDELANSFSFTWQEAERPFEALGAFRTLSEQLYGKGKYNANFGENIVRAFYRSKELTLGTIQERINAIPPSVVRGVLKKVLESNKLSIDSPFLDTKAYAALGEVAYKKLLADKGLSDFVGRLEYFRGDNTERPLEALGAFRALSEQIYGKGKFDAMFGENVLRAFYDSKDLTLDRIQERIKDMPVPAIKAALMSDRVSIGSSFLSNSAYTALGEDAYKKLLADKKFRASDFSYVMNSIERNGGQERVAEALKTFRLLSEQIYGKGQFNVGFGKSILEQFNYYSDLTLDGIQASIKGIPIEVVQKALDTGEVAIGSPFLNIKAYDALGAYNYSKLIADDKFRDFAYSINNYQRDSERVFEALQAFSEISEQIYGIGEVNASFGRSIVASFRDYSTITLDSIQEKMKGIPKESIKAALSNYNMTITSLFLDNQAYAALGKEAYNKLIADPSFGSVVHAMREFESNPERAFEALKAFRELSHKLYEPGEFNALFAQKILIAFKKNENLQAFTIQKRIEGIPKEIIKAALDNNEVGLSSPFLDSRAYAALGKDAYNKLLADNNYNLRGFINAISNSQADDNRVFEAMRAFVTLSNQFYDGEVDAIFGQKILYAFNQGNITIEFLKGKIADIPKEDIKAALNSVAITSPFLSNKVYAALGATDYSKLVADKHLESFDSALNALVQNSGQERMEQALEALRTLSEQIYESEGINARFGQNVMNAFRNSYGLTLDDIQKRIKDLPPEVIKSAVEAGASISSPFLNGDIYQALGSSTYSKLLSDRDFADFANVAGRFESGSERMREALQAFSVLSEQIYGQGQFNADFGRNVLLAFEDNATLTLADIQRKIKDIPMEVVRSAWDKSRVSIASPFLANDVFAALDEDAYKKLLSDSNFRYFNSAMNELQSNGGQKRVSEALEAFRELSEEIYGEGEFNSKLGQKVLEAFGADSDLTLKTIQARINALPHGTVRSVLENQNVNLSITSPLLDIRALTALGEEGYSKLLEGKSLGTFVHAMGRFPKDSERVFDAMKAFSELSEHIYGKGEFDVAFGATILDAFRDDDKLTLVDIQKRIEGIPPDVVKTALGHREVNIKSPFMDSGVYTALGTDGYSQLLADKNFQSFANEMRWFHDSKRTLYAVEAFRALSDEIYGPGELNARFGSRVLGAFRSSSKLTLEDIQNKIADIPPDVCKTAVHDHGVHIDSAFLDARTYAALGSDMYSKLLADSDLSSFASAINNLGHDSPRMSAGIEAFKILSEEIYGPGEFRARLAGKVLNAFRDDSSITLADVQAKIEDMPLDVVQSALNKHNMYINSPFLDGRTYKALGAEKYSKLLNDSNLDRFTAAMERFQGSARLLEALEAFKTLSEQLYEPDELNAPFGQKVLDAFANNPSLTLTELEKKLEGIPNDVLKTVLDTNNININSTFLDGSTYAALGPDNYGKLLADNYLNYFVNAVNNFPSGSPRLLEALKAFSTLSEQFYGPDEFNVSFGQKILNAFKSNGDLTFRSIQERIGDMPPEMVKSVLNNTGMDIASPLLNHRVYAALGATAYGKLFADDQFRNFIYALNNFQGSERSFEALEAFSALSKQIYGADVFDAKFGEHILQSFERNKELTLKSIQDRIEGIPPEDVQSALNHSMNIYSSYLDKSVYEALGPGAYSKLLEKKNFNSFTYAMDDFRHRPQSLNEALKAFSALSEQIYGPDAFSMEFGLNVLRTFERDDNLTLERIQGRIEKIPTETVQAALNKDVSIISVFLSHHIYDILGAASYDKLLADANFDSFYSAMSDFGGRRSPIEPILEAMKTFATLSDEIYGQGEINAVFGKNVFEALYHYRDRTLEGIQERKSNIPNSAVRSALDNSVSISSPFLDNDIYAALGEDVYAKLAADADVKFFASALRDLQNDGSERVSEAIEAFKALSEQIYGQGEFSAKFGRSVLQNFRQQHNLTLDKIQENIQGIPNDSLRAVMEHDIPFNYRFMDGRAYAALGEDAYNKLMTDDNFRSCIKAMERYSRDVEPKHVFDAMAAFRTLSEQIYGEGEFYSVILENVVEAFTDNANLTLKDIQDKIATIPPETIGTVLYKGVSIDSPFLDNRAYAALGVADYNKVIASADFHSFVEAADALSQSHDSERVFEAMKAAVALSEQIYGAGAFNADFGKDVLEAFAHDEKLTPAILHEKIQGIPNEIVKEALRFSEVKIDSPFLDKRTYAALGVEAYEKLLTGGNFSEFARAINRFVPGSERVFEALETFGILLKQIHGQGESDAQFGRNILNAFASDDELTQKDMLEKITGMPEDVLKKAVGTFNVCVSHPFMRNDMVQRLGAKHFHSCVKYLLYSNQKFDIDKVIKDGNLDNLLNLHNYLSAKIYGEGSLEPVFFARVTNAVAANPELVRAYMKKSFKGDILRFTKRFSIVDFKRALFTPDQNNSITDVRQFLQKAYENNQRMIADNPKNAICHILFGKSLQEMEEFHSIYLNGEKFAKLRAELPDDEILKAFEKQVNIMEYILTTNDIAELASVANNLNEIMLKGSKKEKAELDEIHESVVFREEHIKGVYARQFNKHLLKISDIPAGQEGEAYITQDAINPEITVVNMEGKEFFILIHQFDHGNIEGFFNPKDIGNAHHCTSLMSDFHMGHRMGGAFIGYLRIGEDNFACSAYGDIGSNGLGSNIRGTCQRVTIGYDTIADLSLKTLHHRNEINFFYEDTKGEVAKPECIFCFEREITPKMREMALTQNPPLPIVKINVDKYVEKAQKRINELEAMIEKGEHSPEILKEYVFKMTSYCAGFSFHRGKSTADSFLTPTMIEEKLIALADKFVGENNAEAILSLKECAEYIKNYRTSGNDSDLIRLPKACEKIRQIEIDAKGEIVIPRPRCFELIAQLERERQAQREAEVYQFSDCLDFKGIDKLEELIAEHRPVIETRGKAVLEAIENATDNFVAQTGFSEIESGNFLVDTGSSARGTSIPGSEPDFDYMYYLGGHLEDRDSVRWPIAKEFGFDRLPQNRYNLRYEIKRNGEDLRAHLHTEAEGDIRVPIDISFLGYKNDDTPYTDVALKNLLDDIRAQDEGKYNKVIANIVKAKQELKTAKIYKVFDGGIGGVGVENWILQNGGSYEQAARTFLAAAEKSSTLEEFQIAYPITDIGINRQKNTVDNYSQNLTEDSFGEMKKTLKAHIIKIDAMKRGGL